MYAKIIASKLKDKVDEISSSSASSSKSINELKISIDSVKKASNTAIKRISSLSNN